MEVAISKWCTLPVEIADLIMSFICDPDMFGYLHMVSKLNVLVPSERMYEILCRTIYTKQSFNKTVLSSNWGSWRGMLIRRPRLRTNGLYSLRTSYWKPPCNDAFWEEKKREFIEVLCDL